MGRRRKESEEEKIKARRETEGVGMEREGKGEYGRRSSGEKGEMGSLWEGREMKGVYRKE